MNLVIFGAYLIIAAVGGALVLGWLMSIKLFLSTVYDVIKGARGDYLGGLFISTVLFLLYTGIIFIIFGFITGSEL